MPIMTKVVLKKNTNIECSKYETITKIRNPNFQKVSHFGHLIFENVSDF